MKLAAVTSPFSRKVIDQFKFLNALAISDSLCSTPNLPKAIVWAEFNWTATSGISSSDGWLGAAVSLGFRSGEPLGLIARYRITAGTDKSSPQ